MDKYSIVGHSKLMDESNNLWGFVVESDNSKDIILSDDYFSSGIVIALDEIAEFKNTPKIKEGQKVKITIEVKE
ncbi:MAG: hypothetical protein ACLT4F_08900 [Clostridia bacterium]